MSFKDKIRTISFNMVTKEKKWKDLDQDLETLYDHKQRNKPVPLPEKTLMTMEEFKKWGKEVGVAPEQLDSVWKDSTQIMQDIQIKKVIPENTEIPKVIEND